MVEQPAVTRLVVGSSPPCRVPATRAERKTYVPAGGRWCGLGSGRQTVVYGLQPPEPARPPYTHRQPPSRSPATVATNTPARVSSPSRAATSTGGGMVGRRRAPARRRCRRVDGGGTGRPLPGPRRHLLPPR